MKELKNPTRKVVLPTPGVTVIQKAIAHKMLGMGEKIAAKRMNERKMAEESPTSLRMKTSFIMKN